MARRGDAYPETNDAAIGNWTDIPGQERSPGTDAERCDCATRIGSLDGGTRALEYSALARVDHKYEVRDVGTRVKKSNPGPVRRMLRN